MKERIHGHYYCNVIFEGMKLAQSNYLGFLFIKGTEHIRTIVKVPIIRPELPSREPGKKSGPLAAAYRFL
jgi:hypothetical protein